MTDLVQGSQQWLDFRRGKVTASNLGALLGQVSYISRRSAYRSILHASDCSDAPALVWGRENERNGVAAYEKLSGNRVDITGAHTHKSHPWFLGSPDGLVGEDGLIEVKCPFYKKVVHAHVPVHYWMQMNACMEVTDRQYCDFVSWTPYDVAVYRVYRDRATFEKLFPYYADVYRAVSRGDTEPPPFSKMNKQMVTDIVLDAIAKTVDYTLYAGIFSV